MFPGPQAINRSHALSVCLFDVIMPSGVGSGWGVPQKPLSAEMAAVTSLGIAVTGVDIHTSWGPPSPPCPGLSS